MQRVWCFISCLCIDYWSSTWPDSAFETNTFWYKFFHRILWGTHRTFISWDLSHSRNTVAISSQLHKLCDAWVSMRFTRNFWNWKVKQKIRDAAKKIAVYSNYNYQPIHGKMRRFITEISKQFQAESNEGPQQQQEKISGQQKTLRWKCRLICLHCEMYTLIWLASLICIKKILSHRINQHIMQEKKIVHLCVIALTKCIGAALPPIPSVHHCHSFVRRSDSNYSVAVLYLSLSPSLVRFVVRVC